MKYQLNLYAMYAIFNVYANKERLEKDELILYLNFLS